MPLLFHSHLKWPGRLSRLRKAFPKKLRAGEHSEEDVLPALGLMQRLQLPISRVILSTLKVGESPHATL